MNVKSLFCDASGVLNPGSRNVCWQNSVCSTHGFLAMDDLQSHSRSLQWRSSGAHFEMRRAISHSGVRAVDLPREPSRYRGLPCCAGRQALSHGTASAGRPLDFGRCQRDAGLAHLRGVRAAIDRSSPMVCCSGQPRARVCWAIWPLAAYRMLRVLPSSSVTLVCKTLPLGLKA